MAIPKFEEIMLPLLKFSGDKKEHSKQEAIQAMRKTFSLTDDEFAVLLPSGRQGLFDNRTAWAKSYMKQAGLVESTKRGYFKITDRGCDVLKENPVRVDADYLRKFPEFLDFITPRKGKEEKAFDRLFLAPQTPEETFETSYQGLKRELSKELLESIKKCSPAFFERLVVELLVKMGYGGSLKDAGQAVGKTGDEGIDGIIKEDRLGLDLIYIQAKRWQGIVGRPEIQKFAGALQGKRAKKGIFITTSSYTEEAADFVKHIDNKIILIDGDVLTDLMIDCGIGVSPIASYELKRIDTDYFAEE